MKAGKKNKGFSLTEVLMAIGVLAVGMIFVAGVFPVAIRFNTIAAERTTAAIVAEEAFAKIKLYASNGYLTLPALSTKESFLLNDPCVISNYSANEFFYPSTAPDPTKQYCWSAVLKGVSDGSYQVTVFVSRKLSPNLWYFAPSEPTGILKGAIDWNNSLSYDEYPMPIKIRTTIGVNNDELVISNSDEYSFINDGYTIYDDATGALYRVLERFAQNESVIQLDKPINTTRSGIEVWVVPSAVDRALYKDLGLPARVFVVQPSPINPQTIPRPAGRKPTIAIYQKIMQL